MRGDLPVPGSSRARLLDAALEMFRQHAYDEVDVKAIAVRAGVTVGALYHHFSSKQGLYTVLHEDLTRRLLDRVEAASDLVPPREKLRAGVRAAFNGALRIDGGHLFFDTPAHQSNDRIKSFLVSLAQEGNINHAELTVELLWASLQAALKRVYLNPESREGIATVLDSLLPQHEP